MLFSAFSSRSFPPQADLDKQRIRAKTTIADPLGFSLTTLCLRTVTIHVRAFTNPGWEPNPSTYVVTNGLPNSGTASPAMAFYAKTCKRCKNFVCAQPSTTKLSGRKRQMLGVLFKFAIMGRSNPSFLSKWV